MRWNLLDKVMHQPWAAFPIAVARRFGEDNGGLFAAGLSFFALLSFAPLLLTSAAVLAFFIQSPAEAAHSVQLLVVSFFPNGGAQDEINHLLVTRLNLNGQVIALVRGRAGAIVVGFVTLIWTSIQIFVNAATAMNAAFEVTESRSWLKIRVIALGLMVASGFLILATLGLSAAPQTVAGFWSSHIHGARVPVWAITTASEVLAVVINALLFSMILRYLPSTDVYWRSALVGGTAVSLFWEIAKKGLASWLLRANHTIYGDLANLILFVLWIYYSMMILLIGAEIAAVYQKTRLAAARSISADVRARSTRRPKGGSRAV